MMRKKILWMNFLKMMRKSRMKSKYPPMFFFFFEKEKENFIKMAAFELQTPRERERFFNVTNYPNLKTVAKTIQGYQRPQPLSLEQSYSVNQYRKALAAGNYNLIEKNKF